MVNQVKSEYDTVEQGSYLVYQDITFIHIPSEMKKLTLAKVNAILGPPKLSVLMAMLTIGKKSCKGQKYIDIASTIGKQNVAKTKNILTLGTKYGIVKKNLLIGEPVLNSYSSTRIAKSFCWN